MEHFRLVRTIPKERLVEESASANENDPELVSLSYNSAHNEMFAKLEEGLGGVCLVCATSTTPKCWYFLLDNTLRRHIGSWRWVLLLTADGMSPTVWCLRTTRTPTLCAHWRIQEYYLGNGIPSIRNWSASSRQLEVQVHKLREAVASARRTTWRHHGVRWTIKFGGAEWV